MAVTRADVVRAARAYVGTPFHHQGRLRGVGIDCVGLLFGVARDLGLPHRDVTGYPDVPDGETMRRLCDEQMIALPLGEGPERLAAARPGDAVLFWYEAPARWPQHMGVLVPARNGGLGLVHAVRPRPVRRCVEIDLTDEWRSRAIGLYAFPGVA